METTEKRIRLLRAEEIECRASYIQENGLSLLLFKDARVDQKILDETFTPFGWRRSHQEIGENLYCTVEVWDDKKKQWIGKQDVGSASIAEKEKGQASDSFKRACFNWGIGRELYTAPFLWIPAEYAGIQKKGERYVSTERFRVSSISYDEERSICDLEIVNRKGQVVYAMYQKYANKKGKEEDGQTSANLLTKEQKARMDQELERTGVALEAVLKRYHLQSAEEMTSPVYEKAMRDLAKSKSRNAA